MLKAWVFQGLIRFCKGAITGFAGRCKQGSLQWTVAKLNFKLARGSGLERLEGLQTRLVCTTDVGQMSRKGTAWLVHRCGHPVFCTFVASTNELPSERTGFVGLFRG